MWNAPKIAVLPDTGTLEGRIIEILQNARRAGATEVTITQKDGLVTIQDNGSGIQDFQTLLDLGGSGWTDKTERSEEPDELHRPDSDSFPGGGRGRADG